MLGRTVTLINLLAFTQIRFHSPGLQSLEFALYTFRLLQRSLSHKQRIFGSIQRGFIKPHTLLRILRSSGLQKAYMFFTRW